MSFFIFGYLWREATIFFCFLSPREQCFPLLSAEMKYEYARPQTFGIFTALIFAELASAPKRMAKGSSSGGWSVVVHGFLLWLDGLILWVKVHLDAIIGFLETVTFSLLIASSGRMNPRMMVPHISIEIICIIISHRVSP